MPSTVLPSQRCFGPFRPTGSPTKWQVPSHVMVCNNPAHGGHFVDTRTGIILTCAGPFLAGRAPGPAHHRMCQLHGHIVDVNTQEVIG